MILNVLPKIIVDTKDKKPFWKFSLKFLSKILTFKLVECKECNTIYLDIRLRG